VARIRQRRLSGGETGFSGQEETGLRGGVSLRQKHRRLTMKGTKEHQEYLFESFRKSQDGFNGFSVLLIAD
jgi:hypothetical protein